MNDDGQYLSRKLIAFSSFIILFYRFRCWANIIEEAIEV